MFRINKMNPEKLKEKQAVQGKKRGEKQDKRGRRGNIYSIEVYFTQGNNERVAVGTCYLLPSCSMPLFFPSE
ncbi:hypothetical protein [Cytobacillus praedii]|uniref:hypothetical protein n=1 Tax=Cytobacillus praedii TaxID=1742358 RepID=UPI003F813CBB